MLTVALPKKVEFFKGEEPNQGKIVIEPCFPGYGVTLGNSIRRVLLSSLTGAAAVGVKITGASHEFMALAYLQEDILEFVLNLKKLRLKVFTDEIVRLELELHGKKEIKASDIKKDNNVEIINSDLVLGHIADMSGSLKAEIFVKKGMGYETIESRESQEKEINYIELDSIYSPVLAAGMKIENVRVGKLTNYDKLILDIKTDGTISPEEAFDQAIKILIDQYNSLYPRTEKTDADKIEEASEINAAESISLAPADNENSLADNNEPDNDQPKKKRGRPKKSE